MSFIDVILTQLRVRTHIRCRLQTHLPLTLKRPLTEAPPAVPGPGNPSLLHRLLRPNLSNLQTLPRDNQPLPPQLYTLYPLRTNKIHGVEQHPKVIFPAHPILRIIFETQAHLQRLLHPHRHGTYFPSIVELPNQLFRIGHPKNPNLHPFGRTLQKQIPIPKINTCFEESPRIRLAHKE